ncbi:Sugar phosphate permease [Bosea sp. 62]|uniref:MFS transporter n=1 Tax=unclassified Bosea (in: a-proteobacteria) TaxID=2653178 RepID=UPI001251D6F6|nr:MULTISPECIES: MFS transporter [unclassified Bosea (in: a-proteobacteria)]CAD5249411.1 Sugar phosphate permease [Bosea sp. 46]CAD5250257.1 Sugar phosphate permease [Bosea sp. 21B]CAD5265088.1 Sugar phosphate permease [Bosea sp. 7B]VVT44391.1 Sugar phosphate permease [Bosea sp. EC-HK365B]VXB09328.1 Sugar phosphate permease [Bosea sp. 29B]
MTSIADSRGQPQGSAARNAFLFGTPLLVLALGHMLSNLLRTLPGVAADVIAADLAVSPDTLASLTGAYHFAFAAGQIPVGVALDRYGVRSVSLTLFAIVTIGAVLAACIGGAAGFLTAQIILGIGCCGMLLCPMTLAAKTLTAEKFGLWSGLIQGVGNSGMLLSASPMAWLVEHHGWRTGFGLSAALAVTVAFLVWLTVPKAAPDATERKATLRSEARQVVRIGLSPAVRGVVILAFASFAAGIAIRGLWGGVWLMEIKHISRLEAGNALLPLTLALVAGPMLYGIADRRFGYRRLVLTLTHLIAAAVLLAVAAGGPGGPLSTGMGLTQLPPSFDVAAFFVLGAALASQPLLFAMARVVVAPENVGKALAAVNLAFFAGAAILQSCTGPIAAGFGIGAVMVFLAIVLVATASTFAILTSPSRTKR